MKHDTWKFAMIGLGVALLLAVFFSPFASSSPDGLERVAEDRGFLAKAEETKPLWGSSPAPDYTMPGVQSESVSTSLAGLAGTLGAFLLALGVGLILKRSKE